MPKRGKHNDLVTFLYEEVSPNLDFSAVFADLDPTDKGPYYQVTCPACKQREAYIYKNGRTLQCNRLNKCHYTTSVVAYVAGEPSPQGQAFVRAVRRLAQLANVPFPDRVPSPEELHRAAKQERRTTLLEAFFAITRAALHSEHGSRARAYLVGRGFSSAVIKEIEFGFYETPEIIQQAFVAEGFTLEEIGDAKLTYDHRWENRIVGPWRDQRGRIINFWARAIADTGEADPKYLMLKDGSKDSPFGLEASRGKHPVLVEGLFDVLSLRAQGEDAIGLGAASLTAKQVEALTHTRIQSLTVNLDNDDAGRDGTRRALALLTRAPFPVYVVHPLDMEEAKDPDEYVHRNGIERWRVLKSQAVAAARYAGAQLLQDVTPASPDCARRAAVERILEYEISLSGERASLDREDLLGLTAERTGYTLKSLTEIAAEAKAKRQQQQNEKDLSQLLRCAQADLGKNRGVHEIAQDLSHHLVSLSAQTIEPPPLFSVARLDEESRRILSGRSSGWKAVDALEVRFSSGELTIAGARTGHGKTTLLTSLLTNFLRQEGDEMFIYYSAEEPEVRIYHRLLSRLSAEHSETAAWTANEARDFLRDPASRPDWPNPAYLASAKDQLRVWEDQLLIVYRPEWTIAEIEAHARQVAEHHSIGGVFVDYVQRIPPPAKRFDRRDMEVTAVTRSLKRLAVDIAAPVIAAAQINRDPAKGGIQIPPDRDYTDPDVQNAIRSHRPLLHQLREGGIGQEADMVLGLMNFRTDWHEGVRAFANEEEQPRPDHNGPTLFEVGTLKNRYGMVGRWGALAFIGRFGLIRDQRKGETL